MAELFQQRLSAVMGVIDSHLASDDVKHQQWAAQMVIRHAERPAGLSARPERKAVSARSPVAPAPTPLLSAAELAAMSDDAIMARILALLSEESPDDAAGGTEPRR